MRCGGGSSQARPRTHAFVPWARRGAHCPGHSSCVRRRLSALSMFDASRKPVAARARRGRCQYQRIAAPHRRTGSAPRAARPRRAAAPAAARRAVRCRRATRPTRGGAPCAPRRPRAPTRATRCACAPPLARGRPPLQQPPCRDVACPVGGRARAGHVPPCRRRSNQHGCIAQQRSLSLVLHDVDMGRASAEAVAPRSTCSAMRHSSGGLLMIGKFKVGHQAPALSRAMAPLCLLGRSGAAPSDHPAHRERRTRPGAGTGLRRGAPRLAGRPAAVPGCRARKPGERGRQSALR